MIKLLSTKILPPRLKTKISSQGIQLVDYNAIQIVFVKFTIDLSYDHYIFTSQNAVRSFLRAIDDLPLPEKRKEALSKFCFCVGEKTKKLLIDNGLSVAKSAKNSKELANYIAKTHNKVTFLFICGNRRREELPAILTKNTVRYTEVVAYETLNNPQELQDEFNGVLFFSPSGVQSYTSANKLAGRTAFCIGESTAGEALKHTAEIVISPHQSIESVLITATDYYISKKKHDE